MLEPLRRARAARGMRATVERRDGENGGFGRSARLEVNCARRARSEMRMEEVHCEHEGRYTAARAAEVLPAIASSQRARRKASERVAQREQRWPARHANISERRLRASPAAARLGD